MTYTNFNLSKSFAFRRFCLCIPLRCLSVMNLIHYFVFYTLKSKLRSSSKRKQLQCYGKPFHTDMDNERLFSDIASACGYTVSYIHYPRVPNEFKQQQKQLKQKFRIEIVVLKTKFHHYLIAFAQRTSLKIVCEYHNDTVGSPIS